MQRWPINAKTSGSEAEGVKTAKAEMVRVKEFHRIVATNANTWKQNREGEELKCCQEVAHNTSLSILRPLDRCRTQNRSERTLSGEGEGEVRNTYSENYLCVLLGTSVVRTIEFTKNEVDDLGACVEEKKEGRRDIE